MSDHALAIEPMYCPDCDGPVEGYYKFSVEGWRCEECDSQVFEDKESYIQITHETVRWQRQHGWGPWADGGEQA